MSTDVVFSKDLKAIKEAPEQFKKACLNATGQTMEECRKEARKRAPVSSGRIAGASGGRGAIDWDVRESGDYIEGVLTGTALNPETGEDYFRFVVVGTGIHGPGRRKRIFPKRKKVLVWMKSPNTPRPKTPQAWKEARLKGQVVYARSSAGMKPNPFMPAGLKAGLEKAPQIFKREIEKINSE